MIVETFFLHDRGKCFVVYSVCILLGTVAGGTFSGERKRTPDIGGSLIFEKASSSTTCRGLYNFGTT
jgi:hypothetical protein